MGILTSIGLGLLGSAIGKVGNSALNGVNNLISGGTWQQSGNELAQQEWQEKMSNTAIQRQVADMKEAGLNPTLALGGGASTPTGASSGGSSSSKSELINNACLIAQTMNNDKNKQNDVGFMQALKIVNTALSYTSK